MSKRKNAEELFEEFAGKTMSAQFKTDTPALYNLMKIAFLNGLGKGLNLPYESHKMGMTPREAAGWNNLLIGEVHHFNTLEFPKLQKEFSNGPKPKDA